ncbi:hypothetical protein [Nocardia gipuzkoensis]|uniref:hypothetical protein n=1 Tax=Nocardia gipuzkoensis TaxID=2749991 RepID=UPI0015EE7DE0|nr:hypothetical protein [Nocardia gipuzkoensis]
MAIDWGSFPAWLSALGTIGTAVSVTVAVKTYNAGAAERRDNERRQARMVTIESSYNGGVAVTFKNRSGEPIFELDVEHVQMTTDRSAKWRVNRRVIGAGTFKDVLGGGDSCFVPIEFCRPDGTEFDLHYHLTKNPDYSCTIQFTDKDGRRWRRTDSNTPTRVYR